MNNGTVAQRRNGTMANKPAAKRHSESATQKELPVVNHHSDTVM